MASGSFGFSGNLNESSRLKCDKGKVDRIQVKITYQGISTSDYKKTANNSKNKFTLELLENKHLTWVDKENQRHNIPPHHKHIVFISGGTTVPSR